MYDINILLQSPGYCCEVSPENITMAECMVEDLVSQVLSTIFAFVQIENISLAFPPSTARPDEGITLSIHTRGYEPFSLLAPDLLDCAIEDRLSCVLIELFGSLNVQRCAVC